MKQYDNWSSPFFNSLWSDTNETFDKPQEDWRIVGTNPFKRRSKSVSDVVVQNTFKPSDIFYIIEFRSKRLDLAYFNPSQAYEINSYVIIEADRGEDCGMILGTTSKIEFDKLLLKHENIINEISVKQIYRQATKEDLEVFSHKKMLEEQALSLCMSKVIEKGLRMVIVDCEYQWDLKKIIFYYNSKDRIDFRELVNELWKIYEKRIWMCSIEKSKNKLLRELI
ncbi:PSP1 domain-containing protein [Vairimorpha necatrix]|uniref:PSP1 domain-containing protein n=1 Tax=Vairimorpha necatrix TaxID=6039 RepID=A0AAX4JFU3_9MICR